MNFNDNAVLITMVRSPEELSRVRLLIRSIRTWGGALARLPITLFNVNPVHVSCKELEDDITESIMLDIPDNLRRYYYGDKVYACARAEELFPDIDTLIWIDPGCLVVNPPLEYLLSRKYDCAVRPVHIKNVGLLTDEPLDVFWEKIYEIIGVSDLKRTVETFVGKKLIRAYYNSHAFSVNPAAGLLRKWLKYFEQLVNDASYQKEACQDEWHKIFLHQAVLSALIAGECKEHRVKLLSPEYNYPYNLQGKVPKERKAKSFNDLVTVAYENRSLEPDTIDDIDIEEPLRHWLTAYFM